jgi:hypothetical protein
MFTFMQMEPSSYPIEVRGNSTLPDKELQSNVRLVSCPSGTIPIWRSDNYRSMVNLSELTQKIYTRNTIHGGNNTSVTFILLIIVLAKSFIDNFDPCKV